MFESSRKLRTLIRIVAKPMQQLRETPLGRINPAAPIDGGELLLVRGFSDERSFLPRAMIAPEIIFIERLETSANRNDARTSCIDRERGDLVSGNFGSAYGLASGVGERTHVIRVTLHGVVRVFFLPMQRIFGNARAEAAAFRVHDGDANTQRTEIDP